MKDVVVDTNILFSTLLGKSKKLRDFLLLAKDFTFHTCKFVIVELFKYKDKIQQKSLLEEEEILELLYELLKNINIFDEKALTVESIQKAFDLCKDVDEKDTPFVAVSP